MKLEETCLQPVRSLSYADLRHGPIAVVDGSTAAVLVSAQDGPMVAGMDEQTKELSRLGTTVIGLEKATRFATTVT